jgi:hypothetical protein
MPKEFSLLDSKELKGVTWKIQELVINYYVLLMIFRSGIA